MSPPKAGCVLIPVVPVTVLTKFVRIPLIGRTAPMPPKLAARVPPVTVNTPVAVATFVPTAPWTVRSKCPVSTLPTDTLNPSSCAVRTDPANASPDVNASAAAAAATHAQSFDRMPNPSSQRTGRPPPGAAVTIHPAPVSRRTCRLRASLESSGASIVFDDGRP